MCEQQDQHSCNNSALIILLASPKHFTSLIGLLLTSCFTFRHSLFFPLFQHDCSALLNLDCSLYILLAHKASILSLSWNQHGHFASTSHSLSLAALLCPPSSQPIMWYPWRDVPHPPNNKLQTPSYLQPCQHRTGRVNTHSPPGKKGTSTSPCMSSCIRDRVCLCKWQTHIGTNLTRSQRIRYYHLRLREEGWYNFQFPVIIYKWGFLHALISPRRTW